MADLATKLAALEPEARTLVEMGLGHPRRRLSRQGGQCGRSVSWLPTAYAAATAAGRRRLRGPDQSRHLRHHPPASARLRHRGGASSGFGQDWLVTGGMLTIAFGGIGVLASQAMGRLAGYSVLVSSGPARRGRPRPRRNAPRRTLLSGQLDTDDRGPSSC